MLMLSVPVIGKSSHQMENYIKKVDAIKKVHENFNVGGVLLFGYNFKAADNINEIIDFTNFLQQDRSTPMFLAVDQEGGKVQRLGTKYGFTKIPSPVKVGEKKDVNYAYDMGHTLGRELHAVGINWTFAPLLDINTNPKNPIISKYDRAFSSDVSTVKENGVAMALGIEDAQVVSASKHFPGHGDTDIDSHDAVPVLDMTHNELMERELIPFLHAIDNQVSAILVGHIKVGDYGDTIASLNANVINMIRQDFSYQGILVTDYLDMGAVTNTYSIEKASELAIMAGEDIILMEHKHLRKTVDHICKITESKSEYGDLLKEKIRVASNRILKTKENFGILNFKPIRHLDAPVHTLH